MDASSQKTAQSKDSGSLLAPCSTGIMLDFQKSCTTHTDTSAMNGFRSLSRSTELCGKNSRTKYNPFSLKQNKAFYSLLLLSLLCSSLAVAFCAHLYAKTEDQAHTLQTVLAELSSLRSEYQELRYNYDKQTKHQDPERLEDDGDLKPAHDVLQLFRSKGLRQTAPHLLQPHRKIKRSVRNNNVQSNQGERSVSYRDYCESVIASYLHSMPKVHLTGLSPGASDAEYTGPNGRLLVWQPEADDNLFVHNRVRFTRVNNRYDRIKSIKLEEAGIYLVYSQIVVNGTERVSNQRDCTQETVVIPRPGSSHQERILMSGHLTQDREGLSYSNESLEFPKDSSLQMGIFRLYRHMQVAVRIPLSPSCRNINFITQRNSSYFGLYRIA